MTRLLRLPHIAAREYISTFHAWTGNRRKMNAERLDEEMEGSVPARALWPWAVFTAALAAGIVLFFVYPPR
jgi:hypothetical protein